MRVVRVDAGSILSVLLASKLTYTKRPEFSLGYSYCWRHQRWSSVLPWPYWQPLGV